MNSGGLGAEKHPNRFLLLKEQWPLVLELCYFTEELQPHLQIANLHSQLKTLSQPIIENVRFLSTDEEKFDHVVDYFFNTLGFSFSEKPELSLQNCFMANVLKTRKGPESVLMLLLCALFEECNLQVQITSCRLQYLLKVQFNSRYYIADFKKKCAILQHFEILELINCGVNFSQNCYNSKSLVVEYLDLLKNLAHKEKQLKILAQIHSYLMKFQPFNLKHISERAVIAFETGDYRSALEDIRSYFQYKHGELANSQLKNIYKLALKKERQYKNKSN